ncbi:hypothetical protein CPB83DRAFT_864821 [Crepidotus variabilis]|uniref:DUF6532 domain-containing protein n=1 Tax=Crepidotus variabilis TaxID=179855 RepID=A0A9P6JIJ0_9AGAR|nr:hypothetical protein CPB83DRAFT_864821 [Crepidotus variabilis]
MSTRAQSLPTGRKPIRSHPSRSSKENAGPGVSTRSRKRSHDSDDISAFTTRTKRLKETNIADASPTPALVARNPLMASNIPRRPASITRKPILVNSNELVQDTDDNLSETEPESIIDHSYKTMEEDGNDGASEISDFCSQNTSDIPKSFLYPAVIQGAILEEAKKQLREYISCVNYFPTTEQALVCLDKAITALKEDERIPSDDLVPTDAMRTEVVNEASRYLTTLKDICCKAVQTHYSDAINPPEPIEGNQQGYKMLIADKIDRLIGEATLFHLGENDEEGKCSNMMHGCIRGVCIDFYYGSGPNALARQLPHIFENSIPERAVALVTVCIYHALDEYRTGEFMKKEFTADVYQIDYEAALNLIKAIKANTYHHEKWINCRQQWALDGLAVLESAKPQKVYRAYLN